MKNLSVSQEFLICSVNEKGKISSLNTNIPICIVSGALLELKLNDCIEINKNMITVINPLPQGLSHLKSLYEFINKSDYINMKKLMETYNLSLTGKNINELIKDIGNSLDSLNLVEVKKAGFMDIRDAYIPQREAIHNIIDKIRSEMLEDVQVTDEVALLVILLDKSNILKKYFSEFEKKDINDKIQKFAKTSQGKMVNDMIEHITMIMVMPLMIAN